VGKQKLFPSLYSSRKLSEGYPDLERRGVNFHARSHDSNAFSTPACVACLQKLIDLSRGSRSVLVVGCGPKPGAVQWLLDQGYAAVGVEAVDGILRSAQEFLGDPGRALLGTAEALPVGDASQRIVLMESLLEHVDSPHKAIAEAYRVLVPGGVLYVYTTNKWKLHPLGFNGEFQVPFFNWFPDSVKESYVYWPLARFARLAERAGIGVDSFPLSAYRTSSFYTMRTDAFDRFATRLEQRFTAKQIREMMTCAGLERIEFSDTIPYWCAMGYLRE
jgi:ubiquinone/menaquinone biosynthesis C-methylase UbiE